MQIQSVFAGAVLAFGIHSSAMAFTLDTFSPDVESDLPKLFSDFRNNTPTTFSVLLSNGESFELTAGKSRLLPCFDTSGLTFYLTKQESAESLVSEVACGSVYTIEEEI